MLCLCGLCVHMVSVRGSFLCVCLCVSLFVCMHTRAVYGGCVWAWACVLKAMFLLFFFKGWLLFASLWDFSFCLFLRFILITPFSASLCSLQTFTYTPPLYFYILGVFCHQFLLHAYICVHTHTYIHIYTHTYTFLTITSSVHIMLLVLCFLGWLALNNQLVCSSLTIFAL